MPSMHAIDRVNGSAISIYLHRVGHSRVRIILKLAYDVPSHGVMDDVIDDCSRVVLGTKDVVIEPMLPQLAGVPTITPNQSQAGFERCDDRAKSPVARLEAHEDVDVIGHNAVSVHAHTEVMSQAIQLRNGMSCQGWIGEGRDAASTAGGYKVHGIGIGVVEAAKANAWMKHCARRVDVFVVSDDILFDGRREELPDQVSATVRCGSGLVW